MTPTYKTRINNLRNIAHLKYDQHRFKQIDNKIQRNS